MRITDGSVAKESMCYPRFLENTRKFSLEIKFRSADVLILRIFEKRMHLEEKKVLNEKN